MDETWSSDLAGIVAATLVELMPRFAGDKLAMLAIDCHPWHGTLALCVLTESECADAPDLRDPAEKAAWKFFECSDGADAWSPAAALAESMRDAYESADDRATVAAEYLKHCADSLAHHSVAETLKRVDTSPQFRLSITHPDDGTEYCGS